MTPEGWQRVDEIFQAAIELKAEERSAFVEHACAGDEELRREVESLITADQQGLSFVEEPAFQMAAGLLATGEPELAEGESIGHFEIVGLIGRGGMGEVYLAKDKLLNRRVALKLLPADYTRNKDRLRRFQQEAQAASALNHPNILTIYELGQVNGQQFIATEFIEGETLRQRLKRASLSLPETLDIAIQIGSALLMAHNAEIVHRDIKPENIMLRRDGYAKVLDFGLAKLTGQREPATRAQAAENVNISSGLVMGTIKYMSPEQARGEQVDSRSDIFSFGVVLYEMLTGRTPFEGETSGELIAAILEKDPLPISEFSPDMPPDLKRIIDRSLRKDTAARYQSVADLMADLKSCRQQLETGDSSKLTPPTVLGLKKNRRLIAVLSIAGLAIIALALTGLWLKANRAIGKALSINSLAVLPFKLENEEDRDHLGVGMVDGLITRLGALKQIKVRPTSAILKYQGQEADPESVGQEQQVDAVLHGRIRKVGERSRIAVQLTDSQDGSLLWEAEFDEDSSRLFAVESSIARGLAEALKVNLGANEKQQFAKHYTENPEARRLYIEGRYFWDERDEEGCRKAIKCFEQATDIDPSYALAWAGIADTYSFLASAFFDPFPPHEDMERARTAAANALDYGDTLAEAHCAMAYIKGWYEFDWEGAEEGLKRALELNPSCAAAHQLYGWWFLAMGRMDEALAEMREARKLAPLSAPINSNIGAFLYFQGHYDESLAQFQMMLERYPTFKRNHTWIGWVYLEKGDFRKAIEEFKFETLPYEQSRWGLAIAYARMGRADEARKILNQFYQLAQKRYVSPTAFILTHLALGEKDKAFEWLEKAYEARDFDLCEIKVDPRLKPLHSDTRFSDLLKRMNLLP